MWGLLCDLIKGRPEVGSYGGAFMMVGCFTSLVLGSFRSANHHEKHAVITNILLYERVIVASLLR